MTQSKTKIQDSTGKQFADHLDILKLPKESRRFFAAVWQDTLHDPNLSLQAKALLAIILTYDASTWRVCLKEVASKSRDHAQSHYRTFRELESEGYACSYTINGNNRGKRWVVAESRELMRQFLEQHPEIAEAFYSEASTRKGFQFGVQPPVTHEPPTVDDNEDCPF